MIGNGPSLTSLDLSLLRDEITIGCNSIWLLYDKLDWRPTFHTIEDVFVAEDNADTISALTGSIKVYPRDLSYCVRGDANTIWVNFQRGRYPGFPRFSEACHEVMYWGGTVTYMNLQLAHWLGCNPIYLIGLDMNYRVPDYREGTQIVSREADVNHFHPDYFGPGKRWHDPNVERMQQCLDHARAFLESRGIEVCNATRGGKLDSYPRRKYEEVIAEPDPRAPSPAELDAAPPGSRAWWAQVERRPRLRGVAEPAVELPRVDRPHKDWRAHATMALEGIRPVPLSVQIQTTSHCNGQCVICPYPESWHKQNPGRMADELFDRIIAQLKPRRLDRLCLYLENEPFLDAEMLDRLRRVSRELRFECLNIGTNAAPLTPDKARELAEICRNVPHE
ncbi:MAG TPA: 6-hydroxymethylpterin diphosphokinase MptE-like protein, partial [Phycisphaerae bacterium]|nr:6-hydroxymethylpterin diphosphokinase MptE-like protein [Phycisphaerae bacterium]